MSADTEIPHTKIVVTLEPLDDGGLRAYSDEVPGFVLSGADRDAVLDDIEPALATILSHMWGVQVVARRLRSLSELDDDDATGLAPGRPREYVAYHAH